MLLQSGVPWRVLRAEEPARADREDCKEGQSDCNKEEPSTRIAGRGKEEREPEECDAESGACGGEDAAPQVKAAVVALQSNPGLKAATNAVDVLYGRRQEAPNMSLARLPLGSDSQRQFTPIHQAALGAPMSRRLDGPAAIVPVVLTSDEDAEPRDALAARPGRTDAETLAGLAERHPRLRELLAARRVDNPGHVSALALAFSNWRGPADGSIDEIFDQIVPRERPVAPAAPAALTGDFRAVAGRVYTVWRGADGRAVVRTEETTAADVGVRYCGDQACLDARRFTAVNQAERWLHSLGLCRDGCAPTLDAAIQRQIQEYAAVVAALPPRPHGAVVQEPAPLTRGQAPDANPWRHLGPRPDATWSETLLGPEARSRVQDIWEGESVRTEDRLGRAREHVFALHGGLRGLMRAFAPQLDGARYDELLGQVRRAATDEEFRAAARQLSEFSDGVMQGVNAFVLAQEARARAEGRTFGPAERLAALQGHVHQFRHDPQMRTSLPFQGLRIDGERLELAPVERGRFESAAEHQYRLERRIGLELPQEARILFGSASADDRFEPGTPVIVINRTAASATAINAPSQSARPLRETVARLRGEVAQIETQIQALQGEVTAADGEITTAEAGVLAVDEQIAAAVRLAAARRAERAGAETALADSEAELARLREVAARTALEIQNAESILAGMRTDINFRYNVAVPEAGQEGRVERLGRAVSSMFRMLREAGHNIMDFLPRLEGHTDVRGSVSHNATLSEQRAAATHQLLMNWLQRNEPEVFQAMTDGRRVAAVGLGSSQPKTDRRNHDENRRVEFVMQRSAEANALLQGILGQYREALAGIHAQVALQQGVVQAHAETSERAVRLHGEALAAADTLRVAETSARQVLEAARSRRAAIAARIDQEQDAAGAAERAVARAERSVAVAAASRHVVAFITDYGGETYNLVSQSLPSTIGGAFRGVGRSIGGAVTGTIDWLGLGGATQDLGRRILETLGPERARQVAAALAQAQRYAPDSSSVETAVGAVMDAFGLSVRDLPGRVSLTLRDLFHGPGAFGASDFFARRDVARDETLALAIGRVLERNQLERPYVSGWSQGWGDLFMFRRRSNEQTAPTLAMDVPRSVFSRDQSLRFEDMLTFAPIHGALASGRLLGVKLFTGEADPLGAPQLTQFQALTPLRDRPSPQRPIEVDIISISPSSIIIAGTPSGQTTGEPGLAPSTAREQPRTGPVVTGEVTEPRVSDLDALEAEHRANNDADALRRIEEARRRAALGPAVEPTGQPLGDVVRPTRQGPGPGLGEPGSVEPGHGTGPGGAALFRTGSFELTPAGLAWISAHADALERIAGVRAIEVYGFASISGTPSDNMTLSNNRARVAAEALRRMLESRPNLRNVPVLFHGRGATDFVVGSRPQDEVNQRVEIRYRR
ncbi:MAG: hypothetical protein HY078_12935 [Elusimicrobia bacterium]|nr:hypothetical protein [Elusimicrobiota bacterium]